MVRRILVWFGIALAGAGTLPAAQAQSPNPTPQSASQYRTVLDQYCVTCHNETLRTAGLVLSGRDVGNVTEGAAIWEKVIRKLRTRAMPPAKMPRPDEATYDSFATYLETALDGAAAANPNPGRPVVHRLNRAEYTNAIRDLLAVDIDGGTLLPPDDSGYGFDNIGDVLTVSPLLLERYLSAAEKIARLGVGDLTVEPDFTTHELPKLLVQDSRMSEALPLGSRGGIAIPHFFPVDGEYAIQVRLQRNVRDAIIGMAEPHDLDVRLDGERIKLFRVGGEQDGEPEKKNTEQDRYAAAPERAADEGLEVRFSAKAGKRMLGVAFIEEQTLTEGVFRPSLAGFNFINNDELTGFDEPGVGSVTISGPYEANGLGETASRGRIFACRPEGGSDEEPCARRILAALARRAYRQPVAEEDVQILLDFFKTGRSQSGPGGFERGIEMALRRMLVDPQFLFRIERTPSDVAPNTANPISNLELASRLSFFLWSSIPDDELLDAAERGQLRDPAVLERQVRRMLADPRSRALVNNFAGQWLYLRNMQLVSPDPDRFPDFDENLRKAFQQETQLLFESMLREDRSVVELLNADYTFLNERLARHYGIPNIYGSRFRRVNLANEERRGLMGHGGVLTVTSYATRTSPVLRGKWLLENILGTPPPPPPPNVPSLQDKGKDGKPASVRERLAQHRANPVCASCHSRIDPLGFALENFDGIGKWRTTDAGTPVDASGRLPDGSEFEGPAGLRNVLLSKRGEYVISVTQKLLTYALGRGLEYYDAPAVRKITREAASNDYRWSSLVLGIVESVPFQMRRSAGS